MTKEPTKNEFLSSAYFLGINGGWVGGNITDELAVSVFRSDSCLRIKSFSTCSAD